MAEHFNDRLKEALIARGMTAAELARSIGVQNGYMSNLLSGNITQPKKHLDSICKILRIRPQWLIAGKGDPNQEDEEDTYVEVELFDFNSDKQEKKYLKNIRVPFVQQDVDSQLFAVKMPANVLFEKTAVVVVNKNGRGSGLFLINYKNELFISSRLDNINSIIWVHNTNEKIDIDTAVVLGKIVAFFDYYL